MTRRFELETANVLLITGPSGAGRSTAIRALEDLGYEVIDNMPLSLLPRLLDGAPPERPLAFGIDVRNRDFSTASVLGLIENCAARDDLIAQMIYIDCAEGALVRRFSETRRRHPLARGEGALEGIQRETALLAPIREQADFVFDTSEMTVHDLRAEMDRWFAPEGELRLSIQIQSFSYKRGLPRGLDMMFDTRFLRNPHWAARLRALDGRDAEVAQYVAEDPLYLPFFEQVRDLLLMLLPVFRREGKSHLSIGFGCTGGQHRSVALSEAMSKALAERGWQVSIRHREMDRRADVGAAKTEERTR